MNIDCIISKLSTNCKLSKNLFFVKKNQTGTLIYYDSIYITKITPGINNSITKINYLLNDGNKILVIINIIERSFNKCVLQKLVQSIFNQSKMSQIIIFTCEKNIKKMFDNIYSQEFNDVEFKIIDSTFDNRITDIIKYLKNSNYLKYFNISLFLNSNHLLYFNFISQISKNYNESTHFYGFKNCNLIFKQMEKGKNLKYKLNIEFNDILNLNSNNPDKLFTPNKVLFYNKQYVKLINRNHISNNFAFAVSDKFISGRINNLDPSLKSKYVSNCYYCEVVFDVDNFMSLNHNYNDVAINEIKSDKILQKISLYFELMLKGIMNINHNDNFEIYPKYKFDRCDSSYLDNCPLGNSSSSFNFESSDKLLDGLNNAKNNCEIVKNSSCRKINHNKISKKTHPKSITCGDHKNIDTIVHNNYDNKSINHIKKSDDKFGYKYAHNKYSYSFKFIKNKNDGILNFKHIFWIPDNYRENDNICVRWSYYKLTLNKHMIENVYKLKNKNDKDFKSIQNYLISYSYYCVACYCIDNNINNCLIIRHPFSEHKEINNIYNKLSKNVNGDVIFLSHNVDGFNVNLSIVEINESENRLKNEYSSLCVKINLRSLKLIKNEMDIRNKSINTILNYGNLKKNVICPCLMVNKSNNKYLKNINLNSYNFKLAVIVCYRYREQHLSIFMNHFKLFMKDKNIDYSVFVINQNNDNLFNRAALFNIGFYLTSKYFDYFCFHDVDLLPINSEYIYPLSPTHLSKYVGQFYFKILYDQIFGGVTMFNVSDFSEINGYSNLIEGRGIEDDNLRERVIQNYSILRPNYYYESLPHPVNKNPILKDNFDKMYNSFKLSSSKKSIMMNDGINQINKTFGIIVDKIKNYNGDFLMIDVDFDSKYSGHIIKQNYSHENISKSLHKANNIISNYLNGDHVDICKLNFGKYYFPSVTIVLIISKLIIKKYDDIICSILSQTLKNVQVLIFFLNIKNKEKINIIKNIPNDQRIDIDYSEYDNFKSIYKASEQKNKSKYVTWNYDFIYNKGSIYNLKNVLDIYEQSTSIFSGYDSFENMATFIFNNKCNNGCYLVKSSLLNEINIADDNLPVPCLIKILISKIILLGTFSMFYDECLGKNLNINNKLSISISNYLSDDELSLFNLFPCLLIDGDYYESVKTYSNYLKDLKINNSPFKLELKNFDLFNKSCHINHLGNNIYPINIVYYKSKLYDKKINNYYCGDIASLNSVFKKKKIDIVVVNDEDCNEILNNYKSRIYLVHCNDLKINRKNVFTVTNNSLISTNFKIVNHLDVRDKILINFKSNKILYVGSKELKINGFQTMNDLNYYNYKYCIVDLNKFDKNIFQNAMSKFIPIVIVDDNVHTDEYMIDHLSLLNVETFCKLKNIDEYINYFNKLLPYKIKDKQYLNHLINATMMASTNKNEYIYC